MITLIDYMLAPTGQSLRTSPAIADAVMAGMMQSGQTPLYTKAPMFLRELLVFPYQFGLKFERDVLVAKGAQGAFRGPFENPPTDTRQIMDPDTYLGAHPVPPMRVPDFEGAAGKEYQKYDFSVMGQFDVWLLAQQYSGSQTAEAVSPNWRGGYYYAAIKPGTAMPAGRDVTVPDTAIALAYASKWASADPAGQFAAMYASGLSKRYRGAREVALEQAAFPTKQGTRAQSVQVTVDVAQRLSGLHTWQTDQGVVSIERRGDEVLILEGFDAAAASRIRGAVFGEAAAAK